MIRRLRLLFCRIGIHGVGLFFANRRFVERDGEMYLVCRTCGGGVEHVPWVVIWGLDAYKAEQKQLAKEGTQ